MPEHAHVNEQIGILTGGSLTFRIGDEQQDLRPGATWVIPANVPHSVAVRPERRHADRAVRAAARRTGRATSVLPPSAPRGF